MASELDVTTREHAILLFALRYLQKDVENLNPNELTASGYFGTNGSPVMPIGTEEIDALAEYINCEIVPNDADDGDDDDDDDPALIEGDEVREISCRLEFVECPSMRRLFNDESLNESDYPMLYHSENMVFDDPNNLSFWKMLTKRAPIERWGGDLDKEMPYDAELPLTLRVSEKHFAGADIRVKTSSDVNNSADIFWPDGTTSRDTFCRSGLRRAGLRQDCEYWIEVVLPAGLIIPEAI